MGGEGGEGVRIDRAGGEGREGGEREMTMATDARKEVRAKVAHDVKAAVS